MGEKEGKYIQMIKHLEQKNADKDLEIFELKERLSKVEKEIQNYDTLLGYSQHMTLRQKRKHNKKCDEEERLIEEEMKLMDPEIREQYEKEKQNEEDLVDLALEQNQLQFEVHEHFQQIKSNTNCTYDKYKQTKLDFLRVLNEFHDMVGTDFQVSVFEILEEIVEKEKQIYAIDDKIKSYAS